MSKAKQLPSGSWRARVFIGRDANGKQQFQSITCATKAECEMIANRIRYEIDVGIRNTKAPSEMRLCDAIDRYIEDRSHILAPKSIREYKAMARNYFKEIMPFPVARLTQAIVQREVNREAARLSTKTLKNMMGLISPAVQAVIPDKKFQIKYPMPTKHEITIPTADDIQRLIQSSIGTRIEIPVLLAVTCGLRRGEIAALDLNKDIDYKQCKITISKAITINDKGEWILAKPKAVASYRTVEIPPEALARIKELAPTYKPINPGHLTSAFQRLCAKNNLKIRFHDLRHYYASTLLALGVPDMYAMKRMGHSTTNMLKTVYQHIMADKDAEITSAITNHFANLIQTVDTKVDTNAVLKPTNTDG